jgi:hypothetical protein
MVRCGWWVVGAGPRIARACRCGQVADVVQTVLANCSHSDPRPVAETWGRCRRQRRLRKSRVIGQMNSTGGATNFRLVSRIA